MQISLLFLGVLFLCFFLCLPQHICRDGQPGLSRCQGNPPICTDTRALGCELDTRDGRSYCCAAYCDDAVPTRVALGTQNGRCRNGICPSDPSQICRTMSDGNEYCCPLPAGPSPAGGGGGSANDSSCADVARDCAQRADLCIIEFAYDQMVRDCPKTCNVCPGVCEDLGTECPDRQRAGYCGRALYNDLMNWQCPRSGYMSTRRRTTRRRNNLLLFRRRVVRRRVDLFPREVATDAETERDHGEEYTQPCEI